MPEPNPPASRVPLRVKVGKPDVGLRLGDAGHFAGQRFEFRDVAERKGTDDYVGDSGAEGERVAVSSHEATAQASLRRSRAEHRARTVNAGGPARAQIQEQLEPSSGATTYIEDSPASQVRQQRLERAFLESK